MTRLESGAALGLTRTVLWFLVMLNWLQGVAILAGLVLSFAAPDFVMRAIGAAENGGIHLLWGLRLVMVVGIACVPLYHTILTRLLAIVGTVGQGDPFVAENASRLMICAWALLILQLLRIVVSIIANSVETEKLRIDVEAFSLTGWLSVLLLFVLAQVFREGARMRSDLAGTV